MWRRSRKIGISLGSKMRLIWATSKPNLPSTSPHPITSTFQNSDSAQNPMTYLRVSTKKSFYTWKSWLLTIYRVVGPVLRKTPWIWLMRSFLSSSRSIRICITQALEWAKDTHFSFRILNTCHWTCIFKLTKIILIWGICQISRSLTFKFQILARNRTLGKSLIKIRRNWSNWSLVWCFRNRGWKS